MIAHHTSNMGSRFHDHCLGFLFTETQISASFCFGIQGGSYDGISARPPRIGHERSRYASGDIRGDPDSRPDGGSVCGSGICYTRAPRLEEFVEEKEWQVPPRTNAVPSRRNEDHLGLADRQQSQKPMMLLSMGDVGTALSTVRNKLLAHVSPVFTARPVGSERDAPLRGSPADTMKGETLRRRSLSL